MTITHSKVSAVSDGANADLVRPSDWNDEHVIASPYFLPRKTTVTLTDAQIKALPSTAVTLVAAQGAGKIIRPFYVHFQLDGTVDYTNVNGDYSVIFLDYGSFNYVYVVSPLPSIGFLDSVTGNGNRLCAVAAPYQGLNTDNGNTKAVSIRTADNEALTIAVDQVGGNFTGGNAANTMKITVIYDVIDL